MSISRISLQKKTVDEYKKIQKMSDTTPDWLEQLNHVLFHSYNPISFGSSDILIRIMKERGYSAEAFCDLLERLKSRMELYPQHSLMYRANLLNVFLCEQFIHSEYSVHAKQVADKGIYLANLDVTYQKDKKEITSPFLHYAIDHARKIKNTYALENTLKYASDLSLSINEKDSMDRTVFDLACEYKDTAIFNLLAQKAKNAKITPLFLKEESLIFLLKEEKSIAENINISDTFKNFPLTESALQKIFDEDKQASLADTLLEKGHIAPLQCQEFKKPIFNTIQSLFLAVKANDVKLVQNCLLSENISVRINEINNDRLSAAEIAMQDNRYEILRELYNKGANLTRALAMAGPLRVAQLLKHKKTGNDGNFRELLENHLKDQDLANANFSQFVLDIISKSIQAQTLKELIKIFPDLKKRLFEYVTRMIDDHMHDRIGAYLVTQSLHPSGTLYPIFNEQQGYIESKTTKSIANLTKHYGHLITTNIAKPFEVSRFLRREATFSSNFNLEEKVAYYGDTDPRKKFALQLQAMIVNCNKDMKDESDFMKRMRINDKIKICQECLNRMKTGESVVGIKEKWQRKPSSDPCLFKKSRIGSNNVLANIMDEMIGAEKEWLSEIRPPAFNPDYDSEEEELDNKPTRSSLASLSY